MKKAVLREYLKARELKADKNAGEVKIKAVKPRKKVKEGK
jgi:hypothetical protein